MDEDTFLFHAVKIYYGNQFFFGALNVKQHMLKWIAQLCSCFHMLQNITLFYRLLVAAVVGQNPQADRLILRQTTLLPNHHLYVSSLHLV